MRTVALLEEAVLEAEEAASWYEAQQEGLGREFREAFSRSLDVLREGFLTGSRWPGLLGKMGVRRIQMARFPYHVAFVSNDQSVTVLAFAHQRRRPGYWRNRMK